MLSLTSATRVLVATAPVDLHGSFSRLYSLVINDKAKRKEYPQCLLLSCRQTMWIDRLSLAKVAWSFRLMLLHQISVGLSRKLFFVPRPSFRNQPALLFLASDFPRFKTFYIINCSNQKVC
jgi:hypothetical protein